MAKIGGIDLGTNGAIRLVEPILTRNLKKISLPGEVGSFHQSLVSYEHSWRIEGIFVNPSQSQIEQLYNLGYGEVILVDINEFSLFGYGKVRTAPRIRLVSGNKNVWRWYLEIDGVPAIAHTHVQTDEVYLHDLDYRLNLKSFDPHIGRFSINYSADRLEVDWQFYVDNDKASSQDVVLEIQCGDDISEFTLWYWNGSAWIQIGNWGNADAWGATKNFTDPESVIHDVTAGKNTRGQSVTGVGTVSRKLGCNHRVLFKITGMAADDADSSTVIGGDQLKLKAKLKHAAAEPGVRDYARITYIDGSLDYGVA